jgi:hypothetical protein
MCVGTLYTHRLPTPFGVCNSLQQHNALRQVEVCAYVNRLNFHKTERSLCEASACSIHEKYRYEYKKLIKDYPIINLSVTDTVNSLVALIKVHVGMIATSTYSFEV